MGNLLDGSTRNCGIGDTAVAIVADTWWHAKTALDALPIVWDEGENAKVTSASIATWLKEGLDSGPAFTGNKNGDAAGAFSGGILICAAMFDEGFIFAASTCP